jgi:hypothetical protein
MYNKKEAVPTMAKRTITHDEFAVLCKARNTLCDYCEANECERCIVTNLIDDAYSELEDDKPSD